MFTAGCFSVCDSAASHRTLISTELHSNHLVGVFVRDVHQGDSRLETSARPSQSVPLDMGVLLECRSICLHSD